MSFDRNIPYNDLPNLPPKKDIESKNILRKAICASRALAELKQAGELIPNQAVLINTIPFPMTKETLRYRRALYEGFTYLKKKPLCAATAIKVCQIIRNIDIGVRSTLGTKIANKETGTVIYTPPEGIDVINNKLSNWEHFLNNTSDIDPLIRLAIMHYQFEAIHPFSDGNGRTGRILNILYLIQEELLEIPVLYLSRYILQTKSEYYTRLRGVTENEEWEEWIIYMLDAIQCTAEWTSSKIRAIRKP